ncbi:hypothetical protein OTU49_004593 [Cherax quadricarinatus]|uniref:Uncharacterized protein n=1 Tax=Cherax quadricarinatus TaxID=27406 RepID=A0AAW0XBE2_CHEQU
MSKKLQDNPFAALFCSVNDAEEFSKRQQQQDDHFNSDTIKDLHRRSSNGRGLSTTDFLEDLLLVTTRPGPYSSPRVLLNDSENLTTDTIQLLLFDRLLLENPNSHVVGLGREGREEAGRVEVVVYLSEVYDRCWAARDTPLSHVAKQVQAAVITNLATALEQPELYRGQYPDRQLCQILLKELGQKSAVEELAYELIKHLDEQGTTPPPLFDQLIDDVTKQLDQSSLMAVDYHLVDIIEFYASSPYLANILVRTPEISCFLRGESGQDWQSLSEHAAGQFAQYIMSYEASRRFI